MITFSLQSGSNGNSIYVEAGGFGLLFDAGIGGKLAERLLREKDREIRACDAIFISHDHSDHVRHAGAWGRLFGIPLYITPTTLKCSWGIGRVVSLNGEGDHAEVMVEFEDAGRKRLLLAWAPLERVL